jgi:DNA repair protein RecO (recombination protein O)
MRRVELEPAFLLHNRSYRESSLITEIFGRESGRLGLVAKGARRPKSAMRGMLQPFQPLLLSWSGGGDLGLLTGVEPDGYMQPLLGKALFSGMYMNELLMRLMHRHDPHPELFHHYANALDALSHAQRTDAVLRVFEKQMLESIGYGLVLDRDIESGEPIEDTCAYRYRADHGPTSQANDDWGGVRVTGETLLALASERLESERALDEAKQLMRVVLRHYLGERPLATRSLFRRRSASRNPSPGSLPDALAGHLPGDNQPSG